jgi:hypothetical protein
MISVHVFITKKCRTSLKKAYFHSNKRNDLENIGNKPNWIARWVRADMNDMSNCIFIDGAAFHTNTK